MAEHVVLTASVYVPGVKRPVAKVVDLDGKRVWRSWVAVEGPNMTERPWWKGSTVHTVREIERPLEHPDAGWALVPGMSKVKVPMEAVRAHIARGDRKMVHHPEPPHRIALCSI